MPSSPSALRAEFDGLFQELSRTTGMGGRLGEAAKHAVELLYEHHLREEELALPPLGALSDLASGRPIEDPQDLIDLADRLRMEMPRMLSEHRAILAALDEFAAAATESGLTEGTRLAEKLRLHALIEEEVLYPAAVLVGKFLKTTEFVEPTRAKWPEHKWPARRL